MRTAQGPAALAVLALGICLAVALATHEAATYDIRGYVGASLLHAAIYLAAVGVVLWRPGGWRTLALVLVAALAFRAMAMTVGPNLTTDAFRYVWDGRLGWEGINPFRYVPADAALAHLRDDAIFPSINQKERAVTIYPPVAQYVFMAGVAIHDSLAGMKAVMLAFEAVTVAALIGWLRREGLPLSRVAIYAWHPLPIWEFASQAHIDAAATALLVLGIWAAVSQRQGLTGGLFALAALVKYFPVVLLPALWRRWDWRLPIALFAVAALLYLPFLQGSGGNLLGFLGTHLGNEGYRDGWGFHLVWYLRDFKIADPSGAVYVSLALAALFALALRAVFLRPADRFSPENLLLLGAAFVWLTSPHYPWYFAFLCALAARLPHPAVLVMTLSCVTLYWPRIGGVSWTELYAVTYVLPLAVWAAWSLARRSSARAGALALIIEGRGDPRDAIREPLNRGTAPVRL